MSDESTQVPEIVHRWRAAAEAVEIEPQEELPALLSPGATTNVSDADSDIPDLPCGDISPVTAPLSATAADVKHEATQGLVREVLGCVAQVYLCAWGVWAGLIGFFQSVWWHFLDSRTLGISVPALTVLFVLLVATGGVFACADPCRVPLRPCLDFCAQRIWIWQFFVPAIASVSAMSADKTVRTVAMAVATGSAVGGQAALFAVPSHTRLAKRSPAALVLGLLALQSIRIAWASSLPVVDHGFGGWRIGGCTVALLASCYLFAGFNSGATESATSTTIDDPERQRAQLNGRHVWAWLLLGPVLAGALTLSLTFFTNAGAAPKYVHAVGYSPLDFSGYCITVGSICAGWLLLRLDASWEHRGPAMLPALVAVLLICGGGLLYALHSILGVVCLGLALPALWHVALAELSLLSRAAASGRVFAFAGLLVFLHLFAYVGVLTFGNTPVFGAVFGGRSDLWSDIVYHIMLLVY